MKVARAPMGEVEWGAPAHGTKARYHAGCDCPLCLQAENAYVRMRRGKDPTEMAVECSCGKRTTLMSAEDVRRGREPLCSVCKRKKGAVA